MLGLKQRVLARHHRQRGQMLVMFAVAFTMLAGLIGVGADMGLWLVERQRLQTAVDAAAVAGARYLAAYHGDPNALSIASAKAQEYLDAYHYPTGTFAGNGRALVMDSPEPRQFRIRARYTRPTMLLQFVGVPQLTMSVGDPSPGGSGGAVATGLIKADIYVAIDVTASMNSTDMTNAVNALTNGTTGFIPMLGLDPSVQDGPQIAIGRFVGERCQRDSTKTGMNTGRGSPTTASNWYAYTNWQTTTGSNTWCDPNNAPQLYSSGTFGMPTVYLETSAASTSPGVTFSATKTGTSIPLTPPDPNGHGPAGFTPAFGGGGTPNYWWNPHFPGATTLATLSRSASNALTAAGSAANLRTNLDWTGSCPSTPATAAFPSMLPYRASSGTANCDASGTSHIAGLVTAAVELNSPRARATNPATKQFRRVLILQTDGVVCSIGTPFTPTQSENRAVAVANQMKNNPNAFEGIEIFVIMFWENDGSQTCGNNATDDSLGSTFPNCPDGAPLPTFNPSYADEYLWRISSSRDKTCDHYFPANKSDPTSLSKAYRKILTRIAVGSVSN